VFLDLMTAASSERTEIRSEKLSARHEAVMIPELFSAPFFDARTRNLRR
jgi:hypothetical protein